MLFSTSRQWWKKPENKITETSTPVTAIHSAGCSTPLRLRPMLRRSPLVRLTKPSVNTRATIQPHSIAAMLMTKVSFVACRQPRDRPASSSQSRDRLWENLQQEVMNTASNSTKGTSMMK